MIHDMLDRALLRISCPRCGYDLEVTFLQVRLEEQVLCHCCKSYIQLRDSEASNECARRDINAELADLEKAIKNANINIKI